MVWHLKNAWRTTVFLPVWMLRSVETMSKFVFKRDDKTRKREKRVTSKPKLMEGVFLSIGMCRRLFFGDLMFLVQSSPLSR